MKARTVDHILNFLSGLFVIAMTSAVCYAFVWAVCDSGVTP